MGELSLSIGGVGPGLARIRRLPVRNLNDGDRRPAERKLIVLNLNARRSNS